MAGTCVHRSGHLQCSPKDQPGGRTTGCGAFGVCPMLDFASPLPSGDMGSVPSRSPKASLGEWPGWPWVHPRGAGRAAPWKAHPALPDGVLLYSHNYLSLRALTQAGIAGSRAASVLIIPSRPTPTAAGRVLPCAWKSSVRCCSIRSIQGNQTVWIF